MSSSVTCGSRSPTYNENFLGELLEDSDSDSEASDGGGCGNDRALIVSATIFTIDFRTKSTELGENYKLIYRLRRDSDRGER